MKPLQWTTTLANFDTLGSLISAFATVANDEWRARFHFFQSGTTEIPTIGSIDPAGDLWVANNWDSVEAATSADPFRPTSTQGGGSGFTVFYGVAAPGHTPAV